MNNKIPPIFVDLAKLVQRSDPFDAWGFDEPISPREVEQAMDLGQLYPPEQEAKTRQEHIDRIAWFVKNGWDNPIELDVGVPALCCHVGHIITDGNHRAAAAVVRQEAFIIANASGAVEEINTFVYRPRLI